MDTSDEAIRPITQRANDTDDTKSTSDTDAVIRAEWRTDSRCLVFSHSAKAWLPGRVTRVFRDDEGEWLEVQYGDKNVKELQRDSADIRPFSVCARLCLTLSEGLIAMCKCALYRATTTSTSTST